MINKAPEGTVIKIIIHGKPLLMNIGYTYPLTTRYFKTFNNPLVELVHQAFLIKQKKVFVVDVGAAIGDTFFLLKANNGDELEKVLCIDGDDEFYTYLNYNLRHSKNATSLKYFLSATDGEMQNSLIHIHQGTASAQGKNKTETISLNSVIVQSGFLPIDVLKIDVDGFDGTVLKGADRILQNYQPAVIFEYHPILIRKTKKDFYLPFQVLNENGYKHFLWYTKYGTFSHFMFGYDNKLIEYYATICINGKIDYDMHFDVIALPNSNDFNIIALAELEFAKSKKSPF